ncbi:DUF1552 domain-containing protein [Marinicellulosiphila megalodicopiae]|uniref:DUF1552 domain-containing protein n=1 Tax=Marinicellulosiphila megalodicopiae TaxID=2724896 RepID=UPI003BAF3AAF
MNIKKLLTRRQILASVGGMAAVTGLIPFIPRLEAAEGDASIKRYTYWHEYTMPENSIVNANYQANTGALNFKNDYAPLNEMSDKLIFLRKMSRKQSTIIVQGPHPFGVQGITGWQGSVKEKYNPNATSLDQFLAEKLSGQTPYSDLRAGFRNSGGQGDIDISSSVVKGKPIPRFQSPLAMYNSVFKHFNPGLSESDMPASELLRQRKSVLDFMKADIAKIEAKVSHFDKQRIDAHLTAIRKTEQTLEAQLGGTSNRTCDLVMSPGELAEKENLIYPVYSQLITQALSCDMTRVAGMCFGGTTSNLKYSFLNSYSGKGNWHSATHGKDNGIDYVHDVLKFRAQSVASFLKMLDQVEEPDGNTLLDNTIFAWLTDVARAHNTTDDIHCILAGGKGRFKNHGQMVNVGNKDTYNQLQTSIAHFMGQEITVHGDPNYGGTGVLSNGLFV